ncbi:MAG: N-acetylmuramoyl-L-alanine amidase [Terriglobales bacterium]
MTNSDRGQRASRLGAAVLLLLLTVLPLHARGKSEAWARTQYATAERMRETLNNLPSAQQNRHEYQRVIAAYRRVYYGSPASSKADPSVVAVAELLTEMGRHLNDDKILRSAIGQYKFLRREYPGSRDRFDALFTIGQIYQDDLKDSAQAKLAFEEFIRRYPHNHLAEEARKAIAAPVQQAGLRSNDKDDSDDGSRSSKGHATKPTSGSSLNSTGARPDAKVDDAREDKGPAHVTSIRHWSKPGYTRVAIGLERDIQFEAQRIDHPERIFFDLLDTNLVSTLMGKTFEVDDGLLKKIRVAQFQPGKARVVLEVADHSDYTTFLLTDPPRLVIDVHSKNVPVSNVQAKAVRAADDPDKDANDPGSPDKKTAASKPSVAAEGGSQVKKSSKEPVSVSSRASHADVKRTVVEADDDNDDSRIAVAKLDPPEIKPAARAASRPTLPPVAKASTRSKHKTAVTFPDAREASPTENGDRSLIRALGLKIGKIVIDPGHGGHDTGTIGPHGLEEKDLVLDVGRRLGKLLQTRLGADVVYTRKDDTFIPLETRTSIANQEQADLFVSIHANSSRDPDARGVETYYLNFTSSAEALDVAARENAASDKSIHELQDLVKKIALKEKIEESREFASNVQSALHSGLAAKSPGIRDRGVKKAPFIVLIGANMPSILAEISFVSNPGDERRLRTSEYRQRIAESLYRGISKYVSGLSGVRVASKIDKDESQ